MKVYKAETGQIINWHSTAKIISNVEDLKEEIEKDTGVPVEDQILMTDFGKLVKNDNLPQILQSVGKDEFIVFCYDRRYLGAREDDILALIDSETPPLEPPPAAFNGNSIFTQFKKSLRALSPDEICKAYLSLFINFESYNQLVQKTTNAHSKLSKLIVDEQKMQSMALHVAMTNLKSHTKLSEACIQLFVTKAEKEYYRQKSLLTSLNDDLTILSKVDIHPTIAKIISPAHSQKKSLVDFVDLDHIDIVRKDTIQLCNYLSTQIKLLKEEMKELNLEEATFQDQVHISSDLQSLDSTLFDIQSLEGDIRKMRARTKRDFLRVCEKVARLLNKPLDTLIDSLPASLDIEPSTSNSLHSSAFLSNSTLDIRKPSDKKRAFESMDHLAQFHISDYIPALIKYEHSIRQKTLELITSKRKAIKMFIINMNIVSKFEQHVGKIQPSVNEHFEYLNAFKEKYDSKDLESLRHILFAYGATMIELYRRKEYTNMLVANTSLMADVFSQYRIDEENRRDYFKRVISKSFPFKPTILDKASAQCEISVVGTSSSDGSDLRKKDISEFISLITQVYSVSPQLIHSHKRSLQRNLSTSKQGMSKFLSRTFQDEEKFLNLLREMVKDLDDMQDQFLASINDHFIKGEEAPVLTRNSPHLEEESMDRQFSQLTLRQDSDSIHLDSSTYSVVEDEKKTLVENRRLKDDLENAEENIDLLEQKAQDQTDEIAHLKDIIKTLEFEKEEFESQRQSFLKEIQHKNETHDIRIQAIHEDHNTKMCDLQYQLDEEKRMKENLKIEHASEIKTLKTEHSTELELLNSELQKEIEKSKSLQNENGELKQQLKEIQESLNVLNQKLQDERVSHEEQLVTLQRNLEEKEQVAEEIKALQQQTRSMVKRAQDDWESKNEELKRRRKEQEGVEAAAKDLLRRFRPNDPELNRMKLDEYIRDFQKNLEDFEHEYGTMKEDLSAATKELSEVTHGYNTLIDSHNEWRTIANHMAEKLEEYRKQIIFEIINQLQLPVEEEELNLLQKRVTPSDDNTAIWNEILHLTSSIDTQKFVHSVHKRVKDNYEQAKNYKKEYKHIKEKYNKLCTVYCEKIAFRNFKVGDVALFLPTKNAFLGKPWAAFNINAPFYFLKNNNPFESASREWIVARIINITEHTADKSNPESVQYGLEDGTKYHLIEVEDWKFHKQRIMKKRHISKEAGSANVASSISTEQSGSTSTALSRFSTAYNNEQSTFK